MTEEAGETFHASEDVLLAVERTVTERRSVPLSAIRADKGAQPRESINTRIVAEFAQHMTRGDVFPALDVFFDGEVFWLGDGHHGSRPLYARSARRANSNASFIAAGSGKPYCFRAAPPRSTAVGAPSRTSAARLRRC
jgi:hypothetical protein